MFGSFFGLSSDEAAALSDLLRSLQQSAMAYRFVLGAATVREDRVDAARQALVDATSALDRFREQLRECGKLTDALDSYIFLQANTIRANPFQPIVGAMQFNAFATYYVMLNTLGVYMSQMMYARMSQGATSAPQQARTRLRLANSDAIDSEPSEEVPNLFGASSSLGQLLREGQPARAQGSLEEVALLSEATLRSMQRAHCISGRRDAVAVPGLSLTGLLLARYMLQEEYPESHRQLGGHWSRRDADPAFDADSDTDSDDDTASVDADSVTAASDGGYDEYKPDGDVHTDRAESVQHQQLWTSASPRGTLPPGHEHGQQPRRQ